LNQLSSASFSLDFYNTLASKFLPKLSASLPDLGILVIFASPMLRKPGKLTAFLHIGLVYVKEASKNEALP